MFDYAPLCGDPKLDAATKKFNAAVSVFDHIFDKVQVFPEFKPMKNSIEYTMFFKFKGEKYRFDYEIELDKKLPRVSDIRNILWNTLQRNRPRAHNHVSLA